MQITFLGTGASEGIPSMHCKCSVCESARKNKGKEIRSRMGVLIDDALMIDNSPDAFLNAIRYNIDYSKIKHLLITHSHSDHCHIDDIVPNIIYPLRNEFQPLTVYANASVLEKLEKRSYDKNVMKVRELYYEATIDVGGYQVTPFRAIHILSEKCMMFLIEKDGKRYLHLADTGMLGEEIFHWFTSRKITVDALAIDTTYGLIETEYFGHMNSDQVIATCEKFRRLGIVNEQSQVYMTHICHWGGSHEALSEKAEKHGIQVAYDGLKIEI